VTLVPSDLGSVLVGLVTARSAFSIVLDLLALASFLIPTLVRRADVSYARALPYVAAFSLALGAFSIATGVFNNGTDEPYAAAYWLSVLLHGHNPYVYHLTITYTQYQLFPPPEFQTLSPTTTFVYMPLAAFLAVPGGGTGFKVFSLLLWAGTLYLVRKERWTALVWGSPVLALMAANGFNDTVAILLLTVGLLRPGSLATSKAAEYVSFGMKQFAPYIMGVYYLARRQWLMIGVTLGVTLLILLPFILWGPAFDVLCTAFVVVPLHSCPASYPLPMAAYVHWNYYFWPVWLGALFLPRLSRWARSEVGLPHYAWAARRLGPEGAGRGGNLRLTVTFALAYVHWWVRPRYPSAGSAGPGGGRSGPGSAPPVEPRDPFEDWSPAPEPASRLTRQT
jgi:hypothetical protein